MERWQWTWLVNQEAMFGRPVRLAFQGEANTPETKVIRDLWTLLLLRALAGNGTRTAPAWPPVIMKEEEQGQIVNAPGSIATYSGPHPWARTDDSGACRITYPGTGAYPTADIDPCNAHYMLASVYDAGLAGLDAAGVPCLTSAGHRFMAMVHPALLDPDAVLRWRDRVSALDDIDRRVKARDSWLRNAFRKQKALVNRLRED